MLCHSFKQRGWMSLLLIASSDYTQKYYSVLLSMELRLELTCINMNEADMIPVGQKVTSTKLTVSPSVRYEWYMNEILIHRMDHWAIHMYTYMIFNPVLVWFNTVLLMFYLYIFEFLMTKWNNRGNSFGRGYLMVAPRCHSLATKDILWKCSDSK